VQVVHNHEETLARIAGTQPPEGFTDLGQALAATKEPTEAAACTS
jgi:hypothetical protein